ncbi:hypothetical protein HWV62_37197 [Athelia sp. TMB]|nr:hypothetical protein HWV62_37197 [Athelia sp. TMB]
MLTIVGEEDAGTDAKVAKLKSCSVKILGLATLEPIEVWGDSFDGVVSPARTSIDQLCSALSHGNRSPSPASTVATPRARDSGLLTPTATPSGTKKMFRRGARTASIATLLRDGDPRLPAHLPRALEYTPHPDRLEPTPPSRDVHQDQDITFASGVSPVSPCTQASKDEALVTRMLLGRNLLIIFYILYFGLTVRECYVETFLFAPAKKSVWLVTLHTRTRAFPSIVPTRQGPPLSASQTSSLRLIPLIARDILGGHQPPSESLVHLQFPVPHRLKRALVIYTRAHKEPNDQYLNIGRTSVYNRRADSHPGVCGPPVQAVAAEINLWRQRRRSVILATEIPIVQAPLGESQRALLIYRPNPHILGLHADHLHKVSPRAEWPILEH